MNGYTRVRLFVPYRQFNPGERCAIPDGEAERLVRDGQAVYVDENGEELAPDAVIDLREDPDDGTESENGADTPSNDESGTGANDDDPSMPDDVDEEETVPDNGGATSDDHATAKGRRRSSKS